MGLFNGILGNVIGLVLGGGQSGQNPLGAILGNLAGVSGGGNGLLQIGLSLLQQNGGLEGVLGKFRQAGMGDQADSWVSTGPNMGISPEQLQEVLGSGALGDIASKLGLSLDQAGSALSQFLPELINQLTPQGQVPSDSNNSIAEGLAALASSLGR